MCGGGKWAAGDRLHLPVGLFGVFKGPKNTSHKPRGPKRNLTNTGVNFRHKSPI